MSDFLSVPDSRSLPTSALVPVSSAQEEQFLRLYLMPNLPALLPIQQIGEVMTVSREQIMPIPQMPAWVMGIYNWRGEILWMVDLGHLCGLAPWYEQASYVSLHSVVVLRVRETASVSQTLGLVVNSVEDTEWCHLNAIQSSPLSAIPAQMAAFLRGYWWKADDDMLAVLNGEAIIAAMPKA